MATSSDGEGQRAACAGSSVECTVAGGTWRGDGLDCARLFCLCVTPAHRLRDSERQSAHKQAKPSALARGHNLDGCEHARRLHRLERKAHRVDSKVTRHNADCRGGPGARAHDRQSCTFIGTSNAPPVTEQRRERLLWLPGSLFPFVRPAWMARERWCG